MKRKVISLSFLFLISLEVSINVALSRGIFFNPGINFQPFADCCKALANMYIPFGH